MLGMRFDMNHELFDIILPWFRIMLCIIFTDAPAGSSDTTKPLSVSSCDCEKKNETLVTTTSTSPPNEIGKNKKTSQVEHLHRVQPLYALKWCYETPLPLFHCRCGRSSIRTPIYLSWMLIIIMLNYVSSCTCYTTRAFKCNLIPVTSCL